MDKDLPYLDHGCKIKKNRQVRLGGGKMRAKSRLIYGLSTVGGSGDDAKNQKEYD